MAPAPRGSYIPSFPFITDRATLLGLCVALGIGLLIGAERERHKGSGPTRGSAGIRTFAVTSLLGAVSLLLGGGPLLAVTTLIVGLFSLIAYQRTSASDPGLTSEVALLLTCLLGGLAMRDALLAAGLGTTLAVLLAARNRIHYFVQGVLTERELHDALLLSAAALIVMPLAPDRYLGPFDAINPRSIARLVVMVMAISSLGYVALRSLGPRFGLPLAGFASGFVSSTATIYAMGVRASQHKSQMTGAVAGAILSSVATIVQLAVVVALVLPAMLTPLLLPLLLGGVAAGGFAVLFILRQKGTDEGNPEQESGRAFDLKTALGFAATVTIVLLISAALNTWLGSRGTLLAAAVTGLVDAHATAASVASMVAVQKLSIEEGMWPLLVGLTTNSLMKCVVAYKAGGAQYAARIVPGIVWIVVAIWLGAWLA